MPRSHGAPTAFPRRSKNCRTSRCAQYDLKQRRVSTVTSQRALLSERRGTAFVLSMHKINAVPRRSDKSAVKAPYGHHSSTVKSLTTLFVRGINAVRSQCEHCGCAWRLIVSNMFDLCYRGMIGLPRSIDCFPI